MTRRSFFVFVAVFMTILMAFSFALAAGPSDVAYAVEVTNGDNVSVNLEASGSLSTKVKGQYISGDHCFKFTIFEPLVDSDWKVDNGEKYLQFQAFVNTHDNDSVKKYQHSWRKNNNGWSNGDVRSLIGTNDEGNTVRYGRIGSGFRVNLEDLKNGEMRQYMDFKWLDEQGKEIANVFPTQFRVEVKYVALPVAMDADRISCSVGGVASDGLARYPVNSNGNSAATSIAKPFADINYYSLDAGKSKEAVPDNGRVTFTDTADTSRTISWYVDSELVSTEYFKVAFRGEPQFSYINHNLFADTTKAGILEIKPTIQDGYTDDDGPITHIIYDIDFSKIDCQQLLCEFGDGETLRVPFDIIFPKNAVAIAGLGCGWDLKWDDTHDLLDAEDYYNYEEGDVYSHNVKMANIIVDGSSTVITPIPGNRGQIVKWMDNEGNEYYHRITIHLRFASHDSYRVETVTPSAGRLTLNCNNYPNVGSAVYENGVVRYSLNGVDGNSNSIRTRIKSPSGEFVWVKVIPQGNTEWYWVDLSNGPCEISSFVSKDNVSSEVYKLEWERTDGSFYKEMITVAVEPAHSGIWMDDTWAAIPEGRIYLEHADTLENHIEYDEASGCWTFAIDESKDPMLDHVAFDTTRFMVKPPEGATHYKVAMWGAPLYSDNLGVTTQKQLDMKQPIPIEDDRDSLIWYDGDRNALYFDHGVTLIKTALADAEGMTIYTVNSTRAGNADSVCFEWYAPDANGVLQRMAFGKNGEKTGEYSYLIKKPYINTKVTELKPEGSEVTEGVVNATAIVYKCPDDVSLEGLKLRCEIPLQKDTHGNKRYSYMKLDLVDKYGNVYKLPPNTEIKVILPYPEGINKDNAVASHFDVWHYRDENHGKHDRYGDKLVFEDAGISFITDSFSPFLLSYDDKYEPKLETAPNSIEEYTRKGYSESTVADLKNNLKVELGKDTFGIDDVHNYLKDIVSKDFDSGYGEVKSTVIEIVLRDAANQPIPENEVKDALGSNGIEVFIPFEKIGFTDNQNYYKYRFEVRHMIMVPLNKKMTGQVEPVSITNFSEKGITIKVINGFSPFVVAYAEKPVSSGSSGGSYTDSSKPSIAYPSAPLQVEVAPGVSASMSVRASNALAYQWYIDRNDGRGFVPISGANSSGYTTSPVEAKHSGYRYFCRISNGYGSVDSAIFTLNVGGMNIPKTGDISLLIPVLALIGAAAARCRRSSK